jgi:hypothetical protein
VLVCPSFFCSWSTLTHNLPTYLPTLLLPLLLLDLPTPVAVKLDMDVDCVHVTEVIRPPIRDSEPPFTAPTDWLDVTAAMIMERYHQCESKSGGERLAPMALIRCSRGGKTRAMYEISRHLKDKKIPVIFVSLNDFSDVTKDEGKDGLGAVCKRIAFAALKGMNYDAPQFEEFENTSVSSEQINVWLGQTGCVLLIDELNNLPMSTELAEFLKNVFLKPANRYLVFSSHVTSTSVELSKYIETYNSRQIVSRPLPLIPSLATAVTNFNWPTLNPREALYYGLVPALIHEARLQNIRSFGHLPSAKRMTAIKTCIQQNLVTDRNIRFLLKSFITGDQLDVMEPLLQLMDAAENKEEITAESSIVLWIPYHMAPVLKEFSKTAGFELLGEINRQFNSFMDAKTGSGDGWEALFVSTLLIRCLSGEFDEKVFQCPRGWDMKNSTVSYNSLFDTNKVNFDTTLLSEFVNSITPPPNFPHIAVYYPTHSQFELYDIIVVLYETKDKSCRYGYQLNEGRNLPQKAGVELFSKSYVIRGEAAQAQSTTRKWITSSADDIRSFFGESGKNWTPSRWKELSAPQSAPSPSTVTPTDSNMSGC